jgi:hypothetical protein
MRNPFLFFADLAKQPLWVSIWVAILALVNIASLLFWPAFLAKLIFITFMVSAVTMMALYSYFGFEKILGTGHVFWLVLVPYILLRLPHTDGMFFAYLVMLSAVLTISLVLDATDVWKYVHGRRA